MTSDLSTQLSPTKMLCTLLVACCLFSFSSDVVAERSVGCLFNSELCESGEICFDDNAFGLCHPIMYFSEDKYRHLLNPETLLLLEREMTRLFIGGYRWIHNYTQCVIQNILYSERHHLSYDPGLCARLLQMTAPPVPGALLREREEDMEPEDIASIKFLPSLSDPNSDYGDEVFIPSRTFNEHDRSYGVPRYKKSENPNDDYVSLMEYLKGMEDEEEDENSPTLLPDDDIKVVKTDLSSDLNQRPIFLEGGMEWIPVEDEGSPWWEEGPIIEDSKTEDSEKPGRWLKANNNEPDTEDDGDSVEWRPLPEESANFRRHLRYDTKKPGPGYDAHETEAPRENKVLQSFPAWIRQMAKFRNNRIGSVEAEGEQIDDEVAFKVLAQDTSPDDKQVENNQKENSDVSGIASSTSIKSQAFFPGEKEKSGVDDIGGQYETVDASYTYLLLQKGRTYLKSEAEKVVLKLQQLLKLPRGIFSNINVDGDQVTFKVNPNPEGLNASAVANKAEELSQELKDVTGVEIEGAGIGDKTKYEVVSKTHDRRLFILTFVLCGLVVGIVVAVAVVYLVRRHARSKEKLQSLAQPETEASQDYQDLCRQRMASKCHEKPEPIHVAQSPKRVSSLSQSEGSQHSPSSRSSTSSWSEEPVTSNMDISTGHMILSYMEDHLKNKDRLDREWEALCAYEAEPCSTSAATLPQNVKKNRYPDVLPYDHSRVVLNDLSNVSGEDYTNASTITDHDPRNPAYIATQGPLPHTAADFWQMVWEQGSVVVVTLTRLMENGVAMCHRYWPEEGSEVYHVYEVHLVSEHIWCDEYLVRSFYLKNLKTSETRTVTQFHFLAWPDNNVPSSTKAILEFRRKVNKSYRGRSCPIVVHCSDGTGRTGTYCLIDMVLNRMSKGAKEIDIAATLEHIRDQRGGMVKTKYKACVRFLKELVLLCDSEIGLIHISSIQQAQFEFVLMAIAEEVHAILKALSH